MYVSSSWVSENQLLIWSCILSSYCCCEDVFHVSWDVVIYLVWGMQVTTEAVKNDYLELWRNQTLLKIATVPFLSSKLEVIFGIQ